MKFATTLLALIASVAAAPTPAALNKLKRAPSAVADSYIVKLKDGVSIQASVDTLNDLVIALDDAESFSEIIYSDWTVLNGYAARLGGAALEHVLASDDVEYVEENGIIQIDFDVEAREAAPGPVVQYEDLLNSFDKRATGEGVTIYSIDTGVLTTHTAFGGRASWGATFGGYANADGNGHGTHTMGSAAGSGYGPATSASIVAVKVLSDSGSGTYADVISGINWVTTAASGKVAVANMSLGGSASSTVDSAVSSSIASGVHYTIAAGNSNVDAANTSPARVATAVTVGAISSANAKASFSNYGSVLDVWFLGVSVLSTYIGSNSATATLSGTSMAAPGVAGILAVAISGNGNKTPAALITDLKSHASAVVTGAPSGTTNLKAVVW